VFNITLVSFWHHLLGTDGHLESISLTEWQTKIEMF